MTVYTQEKTKPFICTYTGKKVNPLDIRPEDISIADIAHHLSLLNRFVGATRRPISIAQHSIYVYYLLKDTDWAREGLFHDSPETYLGDVSKWVKQQMKGYKDAEEQAWYSICTALDLRINGDPQWNPLVREADDLMVRYENLMEMSNPNLMFELPSHPFLTEVEIDRVEKCGLGKWYCWGVDFTEQFFLECVENLGIHEQTNLR